MSHGFFVTGTDTEVGKTWVSCALLRNLCAAGVAAAGYKPVAAGAELTGAGWRNADALQLQAAGTPDLEYAALNPVCLPLPASPHIAAAAAGTSIDIEALVDGAHQLQQRVDVVLVEGAGGWRVPLGDSVDIATLARALGWPVIVVVGMRLGCINHARLTVEAIQADGLPVAGWIANFIDPALGAPADVRQSLVQRLPVPLLAQIAHGAGELHWSEDGLRWHKKILQIVFDSQK